MMFRFLLLFFFIIVLQVKQHYFLLCCGGSYTLHGEYTKAISPYFVQTGLLNSDCKTLCDDDVNCNGYSIYTVDNSCYLSHCDTSVRDDTCRECKFAGKTKPKSTLDCSVSTSQTQTSAISTLEEEQSSASTVAPVESTSTSMGSLLSTTALITTSEETSDVETSVNPTETTAGRTTSEITSDIQTSVNPTEATDRTTPVQESSSYSTYLATSPAAETLTTLTESNDEIAVTSTGSTCCSCFRAISTETLDESIKSRKLALTVNKRQISSHIRKLSCARDFRASSNAMGTLGLLILTMIVGFISLPDIYSSLLFIHHKFFLKQKDHSKTKLYC